MKQIQRESPAGAKNAVASNAALVRLKNTDLMLADSRLDLRGRKVVDRHDEEIGHVSRLFIDEAERKVRMIEIRAGGFFGIDERHFLMPVDAIASIDKDEVHVNPTREHISSSPPYDPGLIEAPADNWEQYYGYYGFSPYWGNGYMYPSFPLTSEERERRSESDIPRD